MMKPAPKACREFTASADGRERMRGGAHRAGQGADEHDAADARGVPVVAGGRCRRGVGRAGGAIVEMVHGRANSEKRPSMQRATLNLRCAPNNAPAWRHMPCAKGNARSQRPVCAFYTAS